MKLKPIRIIQLIACIAAIGTMDLFNFESIQGAIFVSIPYLVFFITIRATDPSNVIRLGAYVLSFLIFISAIILFAIEPDAQAAMGVSLLFILQYLIAIVFLLAYWTGNGGFGSKSV